MDPTPASPAPHRPRRKLATGLARVLAELFLSTTVGLLVVIALQIFAQPGFPLDLGCIRTTGRTGLSVTLVPAIVGMIGLAQLRRRRPAGPWLVAAYSGFWAAVILGGLPGVWNAKQSFCLEGLNFCIVSPWIARLTVLALATPFLLSAGWALRQTRIAPAPL